MYYDHLASYWINLFHDSAIGMMMVVIFAAFLSSEGKNRIWKLMLGYILVSLFDFLISAIGVAIFYHQENLSDGYTFITDSISLVLLIGILFIKKKRNKEIPDMLYDPWLPMYVVLAFLLVTFLGSSVFWGLGIGDSDYYRDVIMVTLCILAFIFVAFLMILNFRMRENEQLHAEQEIMQTRLEAQNAYYQLLLQKEDETKAFRHDIRGFLVTARYLLERGDYERLQEHLNQVLDSVQELSVRIRTGNRLLNAIASDLTAKHPDVIMEWEGVFPETGIADMDLCSIFYNLLSNAFEAAEKTDHPWVKIVLRQQGDHLWICEQNSYLKIRQASDGELMTTKEEDGHGYGVRNMRRCIEKYHGEYDYEAKEDYFETNIVLNLLTNT